MNYTATGKAAEGSRGRFLRSIELVIEKRNSLALQVLAKVFVSLAEQTRGLARKASLSNERFANDQPRQGSDTIDELQTPVTN